MAANMLAYWGIVTVLVVSSLCDSAVLMRSSNQGKALNEASPEYKLGASTSSDVCYINSHSITNQVDAPSVNCENVTGSVFPLKLTDDKFLRLGNSNQYIAPSGYCTTKRKQAKLCPSTLSLGSTWRKCCPQNQIVHLTNSTHSNNFCVATSSPFRLMSNQKHQSFSVISTHKVELGCPAGYSMKTFSTEVCASESMTRFRLSSTTGDIQYEMPVGVFLRKSEWKTIDPFIDRYCVDGLENATPDCNRNASPRQFPLKQHRIVDVDNTVEINNADNMAIKWNDDDGSILTAGTGIPPHSSYSKCGSMDANDATTRNHKMASVLFICIQNDHISPEPSSEGITYQTTFFAAIWLLTCPLLLCAALGNCCIIQKNVHGWILTCYLLSMCILNVFSVIVILNVGRQVEKDGCQPVDFIIKFMYMSTLCWISSINFGLHKTFRYTLPQPVGFRRFILSLIFSLGFPAVSVTVCYYVAYYSIDEPCRSMGYCVLFRPVTIPYYSVPMLLLVLGNFAIFLKTSYTIAKLKREAEDVLQRQAQDHLKSFALFAKLFLLSGGIWLLRVVLFILQIKGQYLTWYGVILESIFSIPEVAFPMIVFHHPEFIKWSWNTAPVVSSLIFKFNPLFHVPINK